MMHDKGTGRRALAVTLILGGLISVHIGSREALADDRKRQTEKMTAWSWHRLLEETQVQQLHAQLSRRHRTEPLAFVNVRVIAMIDQRVREKQTVLIRDGRILSIGCDGELAVPAGFRRVEGHERYLLPGLVDMHTHNLVSSSQHLLNLANGVTTVRDMCGFDWLLETRDQITNNELLAPTMYVTGRILNSFSMGMYATTVRTPDQARKVVRAQVAAGYDFIKVHNRLAVDVYEAVNDEAGRIGIDVVGHIPHEIHVEQAVRTGQRTFEHFKGYIQDWNLKVTSDDFVTATQGADVWNCPTFYVHRMHLRGADARQLVLKSPEMRYVSSRDKYQWMELAKEAPSQLHLNVLSLQQKIFRDLLKIGAKFIAGTDSGGGYPYMVNGFALHHELREMQDLGLSPYESLKTATVNAAEAMRKEREFGTIQSGKRADLMLVRDNPLNDVDHLRKIDGVAVRGIWLSRKDLDAILGGLETILNPVPARLPPTLPNRDTIDALWATLTELNTGGYILRDHDLDQLADEFDDMGEHKRATAARSMKAVRRRAKADSQSPRKLSTNELMDWRADLETFQRELETRHYNLYQNMNSSSFAEAIARLNRWPSVWVALLAPSP